MSEDPFRRPDSVTEIGRPVSDGAYGQLLGAALRSTFFAKFRLKLYEPANHVGNGIVWHGFRSALPMWHDTVTLNVETDLSDRIDRTTLCLDHACITRAADQRVARDMVASFLAWVLAPQDRVTIGSLIDEIDGVPGAGGAAALSDLPQFPTPGYRTFLGYQDVFEQELAGCSLKLVNVNWHRRDAVSAAPPSYDAETMWLWITVRRRWPQP